VAVAAIDSKTADVVFVAEGNRLFAGNLLHGFIGRAYDHGSGPGYENDDDYDC
jgi:hypothetical protein